MTSSPAVSKPCSACGEDLPLDSYSPSPKGLYGRDSRCKRCRRERYRNDPEARARNAEASRRYRADPAIRAERAAKQQAKKRANRQRLIEIYGGRCECCGEGRWEFLAVDHINGGGTKERREMGTTAYYKMLSEAGARMPGYRLLCSNCNSALGFYGYCPHKI